MAEERDIWIDQEFSTHGYRVRERIGDDVNTLEWMATRAQAEIYMDRLLHPEKYAEEEAPAPSAPEAPQKKKPTWTRGISPGDA